VVVGVVLAVLAGAQSASAAPSHPKLREVRTFAFALGTGVLDGDVAARFAPYDLIVVDGEEATRSQVRGLRERGKVVLAYLSVGTIEPGRSWYRRAKPYRLPDRFEEFDEYYAATSRRGYRRLIARRVAPRMLRKGFDGLFLDNTDMIEDHRRQRRGMRLLVKALARLVHRRGRVLFSQNGDRVIGPSLRYYDGWNREDVSWTYDFDRRRYRRVSRRATRAAQETLRRLARRGLLVTSSDYTRRGDTAAEQYAVRNSCAAGALPFVTNIQITRIPARPFLCQPGAG
jgi:polysaccharide biosynthesis protein PelA